MTREEAIKELQESHDIMRSYDIDESESRLMTALDMAIKALEQKPCNTDTCKVVKAYMNGWDKPNNSDAISRQAVLEQTYLWSEDEFLRVTNPFDYLRKRINDLPPVTPQLKIGRWIEHKYAEELEGRLISNYKCCLCRCWSRTKSDYCPDCGAKMIRGNEEWKY